MTSDLPDTERAIIVAWLLAEAGRSREVAADENDSLTIRYSAEIACRVKLACAEAIAAGSHHVHTPTESPDQ